MINFWCLQHGRLPEFDLDQARLGFTSTHWIWEIPNYTCSLDIRKKVSLVVKGATKSFCHSGFSLTLIKLIPLNPSGDVGTVSLVQMSAHML